ncbi:MAG: YopX family protein [Prevotellaceae bacterium]|jgi:uncharacterized phage protein (TIGR01671 family)|nr:YopX family protein [Prevotellaceae bacterium]
MNRTIKFRAKRKDSGEWVYGYLWCTPTDCNIFLYGSEWSILQDSFEVLPETVGQFTGLYDKNGKEIYEGDMVLFEITGVGNGKEEVAFENGSFVIHNEQMGNLSFMEIDGKRYKIIEIIGNIHDNPNLIAKQ